MSAQLLFDRFFFKKKKKRTAWGKERDLEEFLICWNTHRTRTPSFPCARKIYWGTLCDRHFCTEVFFVVCSLCKFCVMTSLREIFGILRRLTYLDCGELMVLVSGFYLLIFFQAELVDGTSIKILEVTPRLAGCESRKTHLCTFLSYEWHTFVKLQYLVWLCFGAETSPMLPMIVSKSTS